ncbi:MAG: protein kinase domain-containing protein, partial [Terriglobales bacterium]
MNVTATDPMLGTLLEQRYRIRSLIARGGMAAVYEALDERLERIVAVKLMHPTFAGDPVFAGRFMREARAAAALNHPHIVAVFDQGHHDAVTYLVMEKVDGTTLRGILRQKGRLSPAEAVGVMEPILAALSQAHDRGFAHRDVKPENVLVSPSGVVKVADFGLARAVEGSHNLTSRSTLLGTVAYLSPEQIVNAESDARSDVYAAGILLYELLTGEKPYTGKSAMDVA